MDRIFIEQLSIHGRHGVLPHEREVEQEFLIDISAQIDLKAAASSDNLADTADYSRFRDIARSVVREESFYLIERLADEIARRVMEDTRIEAVSVTVRKPSVFSDARAGISLVRSRS